MNKEAWIGDVFKEMLWAAGFSLIGVFALVKVGTITVEMIQWIF